MAEMVSLFYFALNQQFYMFDMISSDTSMWLK